MPIARKDIIAKGEVAKYHCWNRCVRQAYLCGEDSHSGKNYEYRKGWVKERLQFLAAHFSIEVLTDSVMDNHLHVEVRTRPDLAGKLPPEEVARRWLMLFPSRFEFESPPGEPSPQQIHECCSDPEYLQERRERLGDLSWFMRCLDEWISRKANLEDGRTGRFWEGRFKCKRLLDDAAVLACMVYIDLNPVRAKVAETPEESLHTGAFDRIVARQAKAKVRALGRARKQRTESRNSPAPLAQEQRELIRTEMAKRHADSWLCPLDNRQKSGYGNAAGRGILPVSADEYLELLDWTGRQLRADKRGAIPAHLAPVLQRFSMDVTRWVETVEHYDSLFWRVVGRVEAVIEAARRAGRRWFKGLRACERAFPAGTG